MEKMGIDINAIQGMTEAKAREIAQSLASTQADLLRAKASLASASGSSGETSASKMFRSIVGKFTEKGDIAVGNTEGNRKAVVQALKIVQLMFPDFTPSDNDMSQAMGGGKGGTGGKTGVLSVEGDDTGGNLGNSGNSGNSGNGENNNVDSPKNGDGFMPKPADNINLEGISSVEQTNNFKRLISEHGGLLSFYQKFDNMGEKEINGWLNQNFPQGTKSQRSEIKKKIKDYQETQQNRLD